MDENKNLYVITFTVEKLVRIPNTHYETVVPERAVLEYGVYDDDTGKSLDAAMMLCHAYVHALSAAYSTSEWGIEWGILTVTDPEDSQRKCLIVESDWDDWDSLECGTVCPIPAIRVRIRPAPKKV